MATYSRIFARRIPWTEEPSGPHGVTEGRHDGATDTFTCTDQGTNGNVRARSAASLILSDFLCPALALGG